MLRDPPTGNVRYPCGTRWCRKTVRVVFYVPVTTWKWFSFTIMQIVQGISGLLDTVMDLLMSAIEAILPPMPAIEFTFPGMDFLSFMESLLNSFPNMDLSDFLPNLPFCGSLATSTFTEANFASEPTLEELFSKVGNCALFDWSVPDFFAQCPAPDADGNEA